MIKALFSRNQVWKYNEELPKTYGHALESIIKPEKTLEHTDGVTATCYNPKFKTIITGTVMVLFHSGAPKPTGTYY